MSETITKYPASYATSGTVNGTSYRNCIGKPSSTTASGNDYANRNSTATITYTFDFSAIPENAVIESVEVIVGGHCESTTNSARKADLQLYSGSTAKGSKNAFTKTSKQLVTMDAGTWTRDELQSAKLAFTIGYYGGLVNGVDFIVKYTEGGGDEPTTALRIKINGEYIPIKQILRKSSDTGEYEETDEQAVTGVEHFIYLK